MTDVVIALTYYAPYVSGLTNVARDVAEGLVARGHRVTVVTTRHDAALPLEETIAGVRVVRTPVLLQLGKGVISPSFIPAVLRAARDADVVNIHAPMVEAGPLAWRAARITRVVTTYHCDVDLPSGLVNAVQRTVMDRSSVLAARSSTRVVVTSDDYADHSRIASALVRGRAVIAPGCHDRSGGRPTFRETAGLHVGFLGRIVEEKGIEYLVEGFSALDRADARLIIGGDFSRVAGGSVIDRVKERIAGDERIRLLGFVADEDVPDLYASVDAFALTSVNAFEAFGIVQVEGMIAGVPAVASDLPGVRQPVRTTGFGVVVPPRDSAAITRALEDIASRSDDVPAMAARAKELYGVETATRAYEELFASLAR